MVMEFLVLLSSCMDPQTVMDWLWLFYCSGVFILLWFLAGGDSSQDEAEDDVKQITVCPNFLFMIVQATVHKKA